MGMRNMVAMLVIAMMVAGVARSAFAEGDGGESGSGSQENASVQESHTTVNETQQHSAEQQAELQKHDAEQSQGSEQETSSEASQEHGDESEKGGSWDFSHDFGEKEEHRFNVTGNLTGRTEETNSSTETDLMTDINATDVNNLNYTDLNDTSATGNENDLSGADLRIDRWSGSAAELRSIQQALSASQARITAAERQRRDAEQALATIGTADSGANGTPSPSGGAGTAVDMPFFTKLLTWLGILR